MPDIATLGLAVDSRPVTAATAELQKMVPAASAAEAATKSLTSGISTTMPAAAKATAATGAAVTALTGQLRVAATAHQAAAGAARLNTFQTQNLAFQMNDMATMLASGQSPFVMMMQQGMQMAQVFGPGVGVGGALKATGGALLAFVTNPLNLAVLGIAAASGAIGLLWSAVSDSEDADDALKAHKELIDRIRDAYGDAGKAATEYARESAASLQFDVSAALERVQTELRRGLAAFASMNRPGDVLANRVFVADFGELNDEVSEFIRQIEAGTADARGFSDELAAIANASDDEDLRSYADELRALLAPLVDLQNQAAQTAGALQLFAGVAAKGNFGGGSVAADLFRGWDELDAKEGLQSKLSGFLKGDGAVEREAERRREAIEGVIESLAFEEAQLSRTAREQAIYNSLNAAGVDITSAYGQQIAEAAGNLYDMTTAQERLASAVADAQALTSGFVRDLTNGLEKGVSFFDALGDAADNLKKRLLDMALNSAINSLFGAMFPTAGGQSGGGIFGFLSGVHHGGYGPGDPMRGRYVHPAHFDDAPRFHGGIGPGERPAVIRNDESVLTPGQMRQLAPRGSAGAVTVNVHNAPAGTSATASSSRDGNGGLRVDVMLKRHIDDASAGLVRSGESGMNRAIEERYGLRPRI